MKCARCGNEVNQDLQSCFRCGAAVVDAESTLPVRPEPQPKIQPQRMPETRQNPAPQSTPSPPPVVSTATPEGKADAHPRERPKVAPTAPKAPSEPLHSSWDSPGIWISGLLLIIILALFINTSDDEPVPEQNHSFQQIAPRAEPKSEDSVNDWESEKRPDLPTRQGLDDREATRKPVNATATAKYSEEVAEVQRALLQRGYRMGAVDGLYGPHTRRAIQAFQFDVDLAPDGMISGSLLDALRAPRKPKLEPRAEPAVVHSYPVTELTMADVIRLKGTPDSYSIRGEKETWRYGESSVIFNTQTLRVRDFQDYGELVFIVPGSETVLSMLVESVRSTRFNSSGHFGRNDHKSALLAIHGPPDHINIDRSLSIEHWFYGNNMIEIGASAGTILRWDIPGSMRAKMVAGINITNKPFYEQGSHQDDVLRLQGTPKTIRRNYVRGTETWIYPGGALEVNIHSHLVLSIDNSGGLNSR